MDLLITISIIFLMMLCIGLGLWLINTRKLITANQQITELVFRNVDAYILLIDSGFNVLSTNFYMQTGTAEPLVPDKVGNLLRCKNGTDAGVCGSHDLCALCPIRMAINHGFEEKKSFEKLEAPLVLYTSSDRSSTVECEVSVTGNYFAQSDGEHILLTIHDITYLKDIQRKLSLARFQAEESDRMKLLFLANTSHEIRTPLNAIIGFSDLLAGDPSPEEKVEFVNIIRNNNELLLQLVNDILDLSQIQAGTLKLEFAEEDLNTIMEELEGIFRHKQQNSRVGIEFRRKYPVCRIYIDHKRFTQIMSNFLDNALKYTSEGEIIFGYEIRENEYYCYVQDTGIGIPEDKIEDIFNRFVKIGSHKQGTGIGLTICRSIVESIGGRIGAESEPGKGSTFWFTFPDKQKN